MAYVYEHWRPDLNLPFWVGKGSGSRSQIFRRNRHYNNIVKKLYLLGHKVEVRIIADSLNDDEAFRLEKDRIELWRSENVILANQSEGGKGGMSGCRRSDESREKQSATMTGRKLSAGHLEKVLARLKSLEVRESVRAFHTGRKRSKETSEKISLGVKRAWANPDVRSRMIAAKVPPTFSEETRAKMRLAKTPEARARISAAAKKQWENPDFRKLVSETMKKTNAARRKNASCAA